MPDNNNIPVCVDELSMPSMEDAKKSMERYKNKYPRSYAKMVSEISALTKIPERMLNPQGFDYFRFLDKPKNNG